MLCAPIARLSLAQPRHKSPSVLPVEVRLQCISAIASVASARLGITSIASVGRQRRLHEHNTSPIARPRSSRHITSNTQTNADSATDNVLDGTSTHSTSSSNSTIPYTYNSPRPISGTLQQAHHDLSSFLSHALRAKLSPSRTVFKGTFYEYAVAAALKRLGFRLVRTGGASDRGVDLVGWWKIPGPRNENVKEYGATDTTSAPPPPPSSSIPTSRPIRVVIQCKALRKGPRPSDVRELESTVGSAAGFAFVGLELGDDDYNCTRRQEGKEDAIQPPNCHINNDDEGYNDRIDNRDEEGILGLLVSTGDATRGVREALGRSQWPMGFLKVSTDFGRTETTTTTTTGTLPSLSSSASAAVVEQFIWNHAATEKWLTGLGVTIKYSDGDGDPAYHRAAAPSSSTYSSSPSGKEDREEDCDSNENDKTVGNRDYEEDPIVTPKERPSLRRDIVLTWKGEMLPACR